jgi:hypothetical protein|tara:strand:+ start:121 stop:306 length:186 start_codon:yes stop_codon:yes gene_type:complete
VVAVVELVELVQVVLVMVDPEDLAVVVMVDGQQMVVLEILLIQTLIKVIMEEMPIPRVQLV